MNDHLYRITLFTLALFISGRPVSAQEKSPTLAPQQANGVEEASQAEAGAPNAITRSTPSVESQPGGRNQSPLEAFRAVSRAALADPGQSISTKVLRYATKLIGRYDQDGDAALSEKEWRDMRGTPRLADLNGDGRITATEMAARVAAYAQRRSLRLMPGQYKDSPGVAPMGKPNPLALTGDSNARALMTGDATQSSREDGANSPSSPMAEFSANTASKDEQEAQRAAARRSRQFFIPKNRLPQGTSSWYLNNDANGDGQITMTEFSTTWSRAEAIEFARYDSDDDGVITIREFQRNAKKSKSEETEKTPAKTP